MFVMDWAVGLGKWWPAQILVLKILKCHMRVLSSATLIVELQRILPVFLFLFDLMYCKRSLVVLFSRLSVIHRTHKLHGI